jgi:PAS domain-containing protein
MGLVHRDRVLRLEHNAHRGERSRCHSRPLEDRNHPTTAATSRSARTNHVSVPTPACLLASAASPSTSSSQTRPAPSARTATAPLSRASITCLKSSRFHSVEQPCRIRRGRPGAEIRSRLNLRAEDSFARVVEASPYALVLVGQSGRIEMVNRLTERMFGHDRSAGGRTLDRWSTESVPRLG